MSEQRVDDPATGPRDVDALLEELSLEEKAGQLAGTWIGSMGFDVSIEDAKELVREHGLGTVAAFGIGVSWFHDPQRVAEVANELQRTALEETEHGIPLLTPVDAVHGHGYVDYAAVFPHGLGVAATRDPDLARTAGEVTAAELRATGANVNYGPTADVVRDPRWGRTFETFGESPLLCSAFTAAAVEGMESPEDGEGVAATVKHFPAYGDPAGGEDTGAVECAPATVHREFLPPFEAAVDAGASLVMPCYNAVNGDPAHGSEAILTELLRERLGFDGAVVSDWGGVDHLHEDHGVARDGRDAARQAIGAGLDQVSIGRDEYVEHVVDLVEAGELSEERVDEAARRILDLKADLGLFEDPYVDPEAATEVVGADEHREAALEAARESQTLLKNEGVLPLEDPDEVLVAGPNADSLRNQLGGWSVQEPEPDAGTTLLEGIEAVAGAGTTVRHERGSGIAEPEDVDAAVEAAEDADVAVVALGEHWYFHEFGPQDVAGPTGEWPTRTDIGLPDAQRDLLERIHATGTPTVATLITGRPLAIEWAAEHVPAILMSYYPGSEGGRAIAETLFGEVNPSGRLPISVPRSAGHLPSRFNQLAHPTPIGEDEHPDSYDPLFPFGHGLSYTDFEVRDLTVEDATIGPAEDVRASVTVENVGDRTGARSVDLFLRDEVASRVRPVREHVAFGKATLAPGEATTVELTVPNDALAVVDGDGRRTVEPGEFTLSCEGLAATVAVEGEY